MIHCQSSKFGDVRKLKTDFGCCLIWTIDLDNSYKELNQKLIKPMVMVS